MTGSRSSRSSVAVRSMTRARACERRPAAGGRFLFGALDQLPNPTAQEFAASTPTKPWTAARTSPSLRCVLWLLKMHWRARTAELLCVCSKLTGTNPTSALSLRPTATSRATVSCVAQMSRDVCVSSMGLTRAAASHFLPQQHIRSTLEVSKSIVLCSLASDDLLPFLHDSLRPSTAGYQQQAQPRTGSELMDAFSCPDLLPRTHIHMYTLFLHSQL
jgi:hypothetical protein